MRATSERMRNGFCVEIHIVSSLVIGSHVASAPRGSSGTPASRACSTRTLTVVAAGDGVSVPARHR